ncbi:NAD(P)/FAD-dependent oxidoreductase [Comamonas piscis]
MGGMTDTLRLPAETSPSPVFDEASAQVVDALIVGAGPVGMFAAFQLGLQGVQAHLCDSLPQMGGQCIALYADKPIYDIPGIALCTGRELAAKLQGQIQPFHPVFHGQSQVAQMLPHGDGRWRVQLQAIDGARAQWLLSRIVLITAGVGAFVPKQLRLEGLETWLGSHVFYHPTLSDAWLNQVLAEQAAPRIVFNGGDDAAVEAVLAAAAHPALQAASLVLMHRRDQFNAPEAMLQNLEQLRASGGVQVVIGMPQTIDANSRLQGLGYVDAEGQDQQLACDQLWVYQGLSPKLGPLLDWNLALEKKQLQVATDTFQTSAVGIYAAGDIVSYPGKRKLILTGFYEATMAAMAAIEYLRGEKLLLEYTTTSKRLHARLGVSHPD